MKRFLPALHIFSVSVLCILISCGNNTKTIGPRPDEDPVVTEDDPTNADQGDSDPADSGDTQTPTDTDDAEGPSDTGDTGLTDTGDPTDEDDTELSDSGDPSVGEADVFQTGPYAVNSVDMPKNQSGAARDFRVYVPAGVPGKVPVIHFQHGYQLKYTYYDDVLTHLASHGFIVVSSQSDHKLVGGDTSIQEAVKVAEFIAFVKANIADSLPNIEVDVENFGVAGHSRGGKVTNRVLNSDPEIAKGFFGLDPVDTQPPLTNDPLSMSEPVQFQGPSMFLGAEKGPEGLQACAPSGENSVNFYAGFPHPSWHVIVTGVGHMDMLDADDVSACGLTCSVCAKSGDSGLNAQFRSYSGGVMAAFFGYTLKGIEAYKAVLDDTSNHPIALKLSEHK
ncbi:hypothetical protein J6Z39_02525 [bacterium]|nr:hypothetical protein [bacterium]MBP5434677.1 hypothetical protein [bacterium]